ncbi:cytochrome-c oxidase, cbb3-type subunit III [Citromicrobium bathyomarinum]|jgi:cytochrome c oxidase cbb3-type subunit 3|uniref:cytochrome-c oxidase, cbb3-type subunit III n=1 Tax=Sphingomonadales TaxID=204457 RepID=UPI000C402726|nr:cytochrome-c oxidase, cbb3-type subunit III [Citromicrobium sp.]MBO81311.1 cytochrome-c oxidase, cbb3-type subunit III [Citromicrobium sp.]|tara:strand:+ start:10102 stop:11013 length:912 start_codon:yes stop_codon:yes gene_type:complete
MANKRIDEATNTETVGHEWDGIEELNTPLPRWWLWTFYATIIFAIVYVVLYPAWPMVEKATDGVLGWSSRGELAEEMRLADQAQVGFREQLARVPIERLPDDGELMARAVAGGRAAFQVNCSQCHGSGGAGDQKLGYPNLNDDAWLWGGDLKAIEYTIVHGVRWAEDDETRQSVMPPFEGAFDEAQLGAVVDHVLSLSGKAQPNAAGAQIFADNCAACHGPQGKGGREFGAPNLSDAIWLRGGDRADLRRQILGPRMGVMPAWGERLDPVTIKMLAAYVHSLGGGEDFVEVADNPEVEVDEQP